MKIRKIIEKIQNLYWTVFPHRWRPFEAWYRLKCWAWYRYTTVQPRTLKSHTWCDRSHLLPHMMFEILSQFVEQELDNADGSRKSEHVFIVGGNEVNVRDEIYDLYDWWHKDYLVNYDHLYDEWHDLCDKHRKHIDKPVDEDGNEVAEDQAVYFEWADEWTNEEIKQRADRLFKEAADKEAAYDQELVNRMCRLARIHRYLWT